MTFVSYTVACGDGRRLFGDLGMYRLKASILIVLLIAAFTGCILYLSQDVSVLSANVVEAEHYRIQDVLKEKLVNAEISLNAQATAFSADPKFIAELADVREKLLVTTPDELKRNTNNKWNTAVFDHLVAWKETRQSEIKQHDASIGDTMRSQYGSMLAQHPSNYWWGKSPDLALAFAAVPMKDGSISSMLIADGVKGKELKGGKRYDEEIDTLAQVNHAQKAVFGHFAWDGKMYMAVASPVMNQDSLVGTLVIGVELSKDMIGAFARSMPNYVGLMFAYSSPKFGEGQEGAKHINFANLDDNIRRDIENGKFHVNANELKADAQVSYDMLPANTVYVGNTGSGDDVALSRIRWTWNDKEETDVYIISNNSVANQGHDRLQMNILIAALIAAIAGIVLMVLLINSILKNIHAIKKGFVDAVTSGKPVDGQAMALLMGESADDIPQYEIKQIEPAADDVAENWTDMMMDFSDEANAKAEAELDPDEAKRLKEAADVEEAKVIYEEYMRLRKENNINTPMEFDSFLRRLQRNAAKIKETHHCQAVTFQVHVSNGNVLLKPKIVKK